MSISDQLDKASAQLKGLSEKASEAEANANAAKAKDKAALKQRVDAAEADAKQTSDDLKASAKESKDETTQWWGQVQDNWKSHVAKVHTDVDEAKANLKADRLEKRAERAEANAAAAVEFAYAAIEEAEYQVLNAALARLDAEDAQAATWSHDPSCNCGLGYRLTMSELGRIEGETLAATYVALFALEAITAIWVPGPGDSALRAAGVLAAQSMLNLIAVLVIAFLGWSLDRATSYVIGFRGGRPLLERPGRTQKFRLKAIDKGEKLFERFTWLGALAAPRPVSGINTVPVPIGVSEATAISGDALNYVAASTITAAVRESIQINGANVLQANIQTDNGIIHIIDKVLVPPLIKI